MARPPLDPGGAPVRLCVKIPTALNEGLIAAAASRGTTVPDFVRLALAVAVDAVRGHEAKQTEVRGRGSITTPDGTRMEYPRETGARTAVVGHRHSAAKIIAGGIGVCECGARRTTGSDWQLPS